TSGRQKGGRGRHSLSWKIRNSPAKTNTSPIRARDRSRALEGIVASNHSEIARREVEPGAQGGELHRRAGAVAVGVEEQLAGGAIVDDAIVGVAGLGAGDERARGEGAEAEPGEHRIVERDLVAAGREIEDRVDIAAAERGGELERVGAGEAHHKIGAGAAIEGVDPGIAVRSEEHTS